MKKDIDALMEANQLDGLLITGPAMHNAPMFYLTGGGHLTGGDLIKKSGADPVLFCNPMERDEAAKTGLATRNLADYPFNELLKAAHNDYAVATAARYQRMLEECGITSGRVALYGKSNVGSSYAVFSALQKAMPEIVLVGEMNDSVLLQAMATKDEAEVERIRKVGKTTTTVVAEVADYLTSHAVKDGLLVKADGQPLTIGDVKNRIDLLLVEHGAENPEDTIFAIGHDAGVPHSSGNPLDPLRLGQTIVFDIYPCERGGGYFYDFTRTWCLGYAPDEAQALYENVQHVYQEITHSLTIHTLFPDYHKKACELFEAQGHPTIQKDPKTQVGYVHSLGHGVGLNIHERPWSGSNATEADRLAPNSIFTIEPGLYYPERGLGVRLEDTYWMRPDGKAEILAPYPMDLVLPVKNPS